MQVEVGAVLEGEVTGITRFGAFVDLGDGKTGMVHISEISATYVKEISDHLSNGQIVKVKVLNIADDGKISLSIKKAQPAPAGHEGRPPFNADRTARPQAPRPARTGMTRPAGRFNSFDNKRSDENMSFEDMMSKFKQTSDDKMSDLKRTMDIKRGSSNRRGSR